MGVRVNICFRPTREVEDLIHAYRVEHTGIGSTPLPSLGLHCTLWNGSVEHERLPSLIRVFENLPLDPASTKTGALERFDPRELVVLLDRQQSLRRLHSVLARAVNPYGIDTSAKTVYETWPSYPEWIKQSARWDVAREYGRPYFGPFFRPHITFGTATTDVLRGVRDLRGYRIPVRTLELFSRSETSSPWEHRSSRSLD